MTALDCIAAISPGSIYKKLPKILDVAEAGSVITKDHGVGILIKFSADKKYAAKTVPLLINMRMQQRSFLITIKKILLRC